MHEGTGPQTELAADDFIGIQGLVHRYADAVVHRDASQWGLCWAEDGRWSLGPGRVVQGREAIVELWSSAMSAYAAVVQTVQNGAAAATGSDRATGRWYISERFCRRDGARGILLAHYEDEYVRGERGWQFASRVLQIHYRGAPDLSDEFLNTADGLRARGVARAV